MIAEIAENPETQNLKAESEGKDKVTGRKSANDQNDLNVLNDLNHLNLSR